ncbi:MAG TPA: phosphate uptake regulator PhoU [Acidobacteriota bacterium]|nr:phosphate uptake regulator PhoU [Acidobacteriota bacterium]
MLASKTAEETRKLQLTGGSTYIVSLPKRWIDQNHLKRGSIIRLREEDGGLLSIMPTAVAKQEIQDEALVRATSKDSPDQLIRKVVATYLIGYSLIHVRAENQKPLSAKQRHEIKAFSRRMLVGTEIVKDTAEELTLQVLVSYPELSVQSALRRMTIITASMHRDAIAALKCHDFQQAKEVINTDDEVDRFNMYVVRQLKTAIQNPRIIKDIGLEKARDCLGYRLVTKSVERTADHAVAIAENIMNFQGRIEEKTLEKLESMSNIAVSMFENAMEALLRQDYVLAESIIEKTEDVIAIEKQTLTFPNKMQSEEVARLRLIIESIRRTAEYATDIAEIVLNLTVQSILTPT